MPRSYRSKASSTGRARSAKGQDRAMSNSKGRKKRKMSNRTRGARGRYPDSR